MTRTEAVATHERTSSAVLDFDAMPLESGMGGDPWRIALAVIIRRYARLTDATAGLREILEKWPTPALLAKAREYDVTAILVGISLCGRRARTIIALSQMWIGDDWDTIMDLPGGGKQVCEAIEEWC